MNLGCHKYNPPDAVIFREMRPGSKRYNDSFENKLAKLIFSKVGVDPLTRRSFRGGKYVKARNLFTSMMLRNTKKTYAEISLLLHKDHSTVNHVLKYISDMNETDYDFRILYNEIEKETKNLK
jgi:hypothetical protein